MPGAKTTVMRLAGRSIARLIKYVEKSSDVVYDPPDLRARLVAAHPTIVAGWHGQFMMLAALHPGDVRVSAMVARHGDAELIAEAMQRLDTELIRGAGAGERKKDRGGAAALRASVRALNDGSSLVMTADVPPGPARIAGIGIITIARMSGRPIVPVAAATKRFLSFDTWSRITVNLPHSKLAFAMGEPISVPRDADAAQLEAKRLELEASLNAATLRAYQLAGGDIKRATPLDQLAAIEPPEPGLGLKIYAAATTMLQPAVPLLLNTRGHQGKEDPARRGERLGFAGRPRPEGQLVWIHAASVGETNAILPLIDDLLKANAHVHVLLTTGTTTSAGIAARRLPERAFHQYVPLDIPRYVGRFLEHWQPNLSIFTESDIWPNLVLATSRRQIPLVLVNARMSPRSMKRWRKNAKIGRPLFSRFAVILAQSAPVARALKKLGAPSVIVAGNIKIDAPPPPVDAAKLAELKAAVGTRPVWLAASTHPGEDTVVSAAHTLMRDELPGLITIIVPRHPERGEALAASLGGLGLKTQLRSRGAAPDATTDIYIADTIGELGTFYALAPVALIGGSLIEHGGQNPIEAVRHGTCVLTGPHVHNFRESYAALLEHGGAQEVRTSDDLARAAIRLIKTPEAADAMRAGANAALATLSGALQATLGAILPLLEKQRL